MVISGQWLGKQGREGLLGTNWLSDCCHDKAAWLIPERWSANQGREGGALGGGGAVHQGHPPLSGLHAAIHAGSALLREGAAILPLISP